MEYIGEYVVAGLVLVLVSILFGLVSMLIGFFADLDRGPFRPLIRGFLTFFIVGLLWLLSTDSQSLIEAVGEGYRLRRELLAGSIPMAFKVWVGVELTLVLYIASRWVQRKSPFWWAWVKGRVFDFAEWVHGVLGRLQ